MNDKKWNILNYVNDPSINVERAGIDSEKVIQNYSLSDNQFKKILDTIKVRHPLETDWILKKKTFFTKLMTYNISIECVDWIANVYLREPDIFYLDAEIEFTRRHIDRLEEELNIVDQFKIEFEDTSLYSLSKILGMQRTQLLNQIKNSNSSEYLYRNEKNIFMVKKDYINQMDNLHMKRYKFKKLNRYKCDLQHLKQEREQQRKNN